MINHVVLFKAVGKNSKFIVMMIGLVLAGLALAAGVFWYFSPTLTEVTDGTRVVSPLTDAEKIAFVEDIKARGTSTTTEGSVSASSTEAEKIKYVKDISSTSTSTLSEAQKRAFMEDLKNRTQP